MKELEPEQKERIGTRMESIKDEIEATGEETVKDITYYKEVEVAGIPMNLYYVETQGKDEKVSYQLFNGSQKIGEGNKTGKQIKMDTEFLQELEKQVKTYDREYSLDEYGGEKIKLKTEDLKENEVCKMSELKEKDKDNKDVILPGLEEEAEQPSEEKRVEQEMNLTKVQRISGREAAAVLGNDTQNYKDLYIGYSDEAQSFVAVGVNGNEIKPIDGVKSYRVTAGGEEGKEEYFLSGEITPTRGGISIVDENNAPEVSIHRIDEKGNCEITELDEFGHAIEKKGIDRNGNEVLDDKEDGNSMKEDDDRGEERVLGPKHYGY